MNKRASLHTLGCRLNQSETAVIGQKLTDAGYDLVPFGESADLAVINTCTVTAMADSKARNAIRSFIRKNPEAYTAVVGCYSQMGYKAICEIEGVDLIIGNQEKMSILDYLGEGKNAKPLVIRDKFERDDFELDTIGQSELTTRANLKIQDGCDFMCSFCIIPFARGRSRSRVFSNILEEAQSLATQGFQELVLTGVNIGTFEHGGKNILDLIESLKGVPGIQRIRISSIEPTTIPEQLFAWMADPDHPLVPYLHIPLQSGSNPILRAMRRKYSREEFLEFIEKAAKQVPDLCIGTDVMVGFPGETDELFEQTFQFLENAPVDYFHVFSYSEREGTASQKMEGLVDEPSKKKRSAILRRLSAHKRQAFYERFLDQLRPVLFEQEEQGVWSGYTDNYIRVAVQSLNSLENRICQVKLERFAADFLWGYLEL